MPLNVLRNQNVMDEFTGGTGRNSDHLEVRERFLRRLDGYRRHHMNSMTQFDNYMNSVYEQQRQDTHHLHQNWIESRAKKATKSKLTRCGQNNPASQKILKQKSDIHSQSSGPVTSSINAAQLSLRVPVSSVETSVEVEDPNCIPVNVTVDATVIQDSQNEINQKFSSVVQNGKHSIEYPASSEHCKSENEDVHCGLKSVPNPSPTSMTDQIDIGDIDGLSDWIMDGEDFFKSFEFDSDYIHDKSPVSSSDFLGTEERHQDSLGCSLISGSSNNGMTAISSYTGLGLGSGPSVGPGLEVVNATNHQGTAPVTPVAHSPVEPYAAGAAPTTPALLGDTGPAAETLKQMAAQHQSLEQNQYVNIHSGFEHSGLSSHYQISNGCSLPGYAARGFSTVQHAYGTGFGKRISQHNRNVFGSRLGFPRSEVTAVGCSSTGTKSRFADMNVLRSIQLDNQIQSHFCIPRCGSSPASFMVPTPVQHHDTSLTPGHFCLSQMHQMHNQVRQGQNHSLTQQQLTLTSDQMAYSCIDPEMSDRTRAQQLYQPLQQQPMFNTYINGMQYRLPSGSYSPNYQSINNRNHFGNAAQHCLNHAITKATDPLMHDHMRSNAFSDTSCGVSKVNTNDVSEDQHLITNSHVASSVTNIASYCRSMKQDETNYPSGLMKQDCRTGNVLVDTNTQSIMGQHVNISSDWASMERHQQMVLQHRVDLMCTSGDGGALPSYSGCVQNYDQLAMTNTQVSGGKLQVPVSDNDQSLTNQGNCTWLAHAVALDHATQHQDPTHLHSALSLMVPQTMHSSESIPPFSHTSSSMLEGNNHCYATGHLDESHVQTLRFLRNQENLTNNCQELLSQGIVDSSSSIY